MERRRAWECGVCVRVSVCDLLGDTLVPLCAGCPTHGASGGPVAVVRQGSAQRAEGEVSWGRRRLEATAAVCGASVLRALGAALPACRSPPSGE